MNGILIIDKPQGLSSHDVVRRVRRAYGTRKVGHTGTLDPLATGVLPVAIGEATRLVQFLMEGEKTYRTTLRLGMVTTTQDSEGEVLETRQVGALDRGTVLAACRELTGAIAQVPPMYSALKRNGIPLYRLAREGVEVTREPRPVFIRRLELVALELPFITLEVECSKGTYIRTLCHDLGELLGPGAHMIALRRTRTGPFAEEESVPLAAIEEDGRLPAPLAPVEALRGCPRFEVAEEAACRLLDGVPPELGDVVGTMPAREGEMVALTRQGRLLAVARFAPGRSVDKRGDFALLRVFNRCRTA